MFRPRGRILKKLCMMNTFRMTRDNVEIELLCVVELLLIVLMNWDNTFENMG
jgi:hypothetical protein